jgi:hypothetical protein
MKYRHLHMKGIISFGTSICGMNKGEKRKFVNPCYAGKSRFYRPGSANEWLGKRMGI